MRIFPALALAAITLASAPVAAQEACPMERAVYALKAAPNYQLEFRFDPEMAEVARTASPTVYYDVAATMRHQSSLALVDFMFYSPSSSSAKTQTAAVTSSPYLGDDTQAFSVFGLNDDFGTTGIGHSGTEAPPTLILPGVAYALALHSGYGSPEHEATYNMPEGAWILTECR